MSGLGKLGDQVCRWVFGCAAQDGGRIVEELGAEFGSRGEHLQDRVHVARIAQVAQPHVPRSLERHQFLARLCDLIEFELLVRLDVEFRHAQLSLLHDHHVDPPVREVLSEVRVSYLGILFGCVRVHVGALRRDRSQLDDQREAVRWMCSPCLLIMIERTVRAATAVPLPASRADVPIGEVEPEILLHARFLACPVRRVCGNLLCGGKLH
mmetsp:Transcript_52556/g.87204  ORF Transcript_52556/g.87204 Transcript_52556/m.87204 type:complete len:210 (+) Transcript_52556:889-1518(+)